MYATVQALLDRKAALLNSADFRSFVSDYDFPMALHLEGNLVLFVNPDALIEGMRDFRRMLAAEGMHQMIPHVRAVEMPRRARFRIWSTWDHLDGEGTVLSRSDYVYHCRERGGRILTEMVQVTRVASSRMLPRAPVQAFRA